jgi:hypothetical protein
LSSKQQGSCLLVSPTPPTSVKSHASTDTDAADAPLLPLLRLRLHFFSLPNPPGKRPSAPRKGACSRENPQALLCCATIARTDGSNIGIHLVSCPLYPHTM